MTTNPHPSTSSTSPSPSQSTPSNPTPLSTLPPNHPIIFTNLLRFHDQAKYPETTPEDVLRYLHQPGPGSESESESESSTSIPTPTPTPTSGSTAYWTRYFPTYHAAARETLGDDADKLQRVIYKGMPLISLRGARGLNVTRCSPGDGNSNTTSPNPNTYWHALVVTYVSSWDVVTRISENERYKVLGGFHRDAAVEDDELFVSCKVEGFEMGIDAGQVG